MPPSSLLFRLPIINVTGAYSSTFPYLVVAVVVSLLMVWAPSRASWVASPIS